MRTFGPKLQKVLILGNVSFGVGIITAIKILSP
jgi:hypothetical protein